MRDKCTLSHKKNEIKYNYLTSFRIWQVRASKTKDARGEVEMKFAFTDLSHHRTCGSAYGGSYFGHHSE